MKNFLACYKHKEKKSLHSDFWRSVIASLTRLLLLLTEM